MNRTTIQPLVLALLMTAPLPAQELGELTTRLAAEIPALLEKAHTPGLSMVLIRDRAIAWRGCFGVRRAGKRERVDGETIFEAASMSKPLFTYAVLKLVEEGRLDLDRPLDAYLPEPYLPDQPRAAKITARMVMLHRTGLPNWREGGLRKGGPLVLLCVPGTRFTYSGEGYLYLQRAVERISGQRITPWMERRLLRPLGMKRSSYAWREGFQGDFAGGHDERGRFKEKRRFYRRGNAAYSLYTTPADYARFLIEMMNPDHSAKHSLCAEMIRAMTTLQVEPEKDNSRSRRALGWVVGPPDSAWVGHSGSNGTGFRCRSRFFPARGSGCVVMTNAVGGRLVCDAVLALLDAGEARRESGQR